MINMMATPVIPDVPATLATLTDMLQLLADPVAAKNRIAEMQAATAELQRATTESRSQQASFAVAQADHRSTLDQQGADAAAKMAADQAAFDAECSHRKQLLDDREARLTELQSEATADAKAAAAARADFERRLKIIKSATG
jgi:hypothetical protein